MTITELVTEVMEWIGVWSLIVFGVYVQVS